MYNYANETSVGLGLLAGATWIITAMWILSAILGIISIISMMKIFKKAGKNQWFALIPIYNIVIMLQIIKMKGIELLFLLIPFVGSFIFLYKYSTKLAKAFGKSNGFAWGLFFLSFIFIPLLAFSDDKYTYSLEMQSNDNQQLDNSNILENNVMENNSTMNSINTMVNGNVIVDSNVDTTSINQEVAPAELTTINQINEPVPMVEPTSQIVEPQISNIGIAPTIEESEITNEPVVASSIETINEVPTIEEIPAVPVQSPTVEPVANAFNSTPIPTLEEINNTEAVVNPQPETIQPISVSQSNPVETLSVSQSTPIVNEEVVTEQLPIEQKVETTPVVPIIEPIVLEPETTTNNSQKKMCKNCGNEMPSIVTICPKCGTDNED